MSDMLQVFVKKEMEKQVQEKYPHIRHPAGMYAKVSQVRKTDGQYVCTLKVLDQSFQADSAFPEIPDVKTDVELKQGDIAVVLLLYGGDSVFILGRYGS